MWPDHTEAVRNDILDYLFEVQRFDATVKASCSKHSRRILAARREHAGDRSRAITACLSRNAKAGSMTPSTHVPARPARWPKKIREHHTIPSPVMMVDVTATILNATGVSPRPGGTAGNGRNLLDLTSGKTEPPWRDFVLTERERHADVRQGSLGYPARAIQIDKYLYIRNYEPSRWPAGDPKMWRAVGPFGDIDDGPTKQLLMQAFGTPNEASTHANLALGKRPSEELYAYQDDPANLKTSRTIAATSA